MYELFTCLFPTDLATHRVYGGAGSFGWAQGLLERQA